MAAAATQALLTFAHELAELAGPIARRHFRDARAAVDSKPDATPVTRADREIETALREHIARHHPTHGVFGEEHGVDRGDAEYLWVIDPIDGTKAFATGNPLFGTLIGLMRRGAPLLGVFDAPALGAHGERYHGAVGLGAFRGERRLAVRPTRRLEDAVLYCTTPDALLEHPGHRALRGRVRWTSYGGDCHAYGFLAAGQCDLIVDTTLRPYDWCALVPIVREAGGVVGDWSGEDLTLTGPGDAVAAATPELAAAARAVLGA